MKVPKPKGGVLVKQLFEKHKGLELLKLKSEAEHRLLQAGARACIAAGIDAPPVELHDPEERADQLKRAIFALMDEELPRFYVTEYAKVHMNDSIMEPEDIADFADLEADEWVTIVTDWKRQYEEAGGTASDTVIEEHIQAVFGMDRETFERRIVFWDKDDQKEALEKVFGGERVAGEKAVFVGEDTAVYAFERLENAV